MAPAHTSRTPSRAERGRISRENLVQDINAGAIEHSSPAAEVVSHVDHDMQMAGLSLCAA
jgi:hypothetical protein